MTITVTDHTIALNRKVGKASAVPGSVADEIQRYTTDDLEFSDYGRAEGASVLIWVFGSVALLLALIILKLLQGLFF